jgi:hypothetical protein
MNERKEKCKLSGVRMQLKGKKKRKWKMLRRVIQKLIRSESRFKKSLFEIGKTTRMINNTILLEILTLKSSFRKLLTPSIPKSRLKVNKIIISMASLCRIIHREVIKLMITLSSLISKRPRYRWMPQKIYSKIRKSYKKRSNKNHKILILF